MNRFIYVYDALCGWCFGFSPVMKQVAQTYPEFPIEVISGGLVLGERVGPIGEVAPYVKKAFVDVEKASGVKFGDSFLKGGLEDGSLRMNSLPPAIALAIFRERFPEKSLDFAHALHDMIYVNGHSPEDQNELANVAAQFGFEKSEFENKLSEESYEDLAKRDFMYAQQLQATGFPMLILETKGEMYLVAKGFTPAEHLLPTLKRVFES